MRINLIGGFLGSGKTTAIAGACKLLMAKHESVGVVTNDQGIQQVDTSTIQRLGIPTREVAGSCFCCNYGQFDAHIRSLESEHLPCVIFAESVGSCTDLVATLARPLSLYRPEIAVVISVFADAAFLASLLEGTSLFIEESVRYIFRKQLEEADLMIINKSDLIAPHQKEVIIQMLTAEYPGKPFMFQNSTKEDDIIRWIDATGSFTSSGRVSLDIDYDMYGAGEASMAWLDRQVTIRDDNRNAVQVTRKIMEGIFRRIREERLLIGHLKFFIDVGKWSRKVSFTASSRDFNLLPDDNDTETLELLINARVQTNPGRLTAIVDEVISRSALRGTQISVGNWSAFVPGYPKPTHRI